MKYFACILVCLATLLSGCSSLKFWEDDKAEAIDEVEGERSTEPMDLGKYDEAVKIHKVWRASVGKSLKHYEASLQPALLDDQVFAADRRGLVSAFGRADGDRVWRTELDVVLTGGVGVGGELVVVGSQDGEVFALSTETGEERWRAQVSSEVLAPPAADDSVVVVQTQDGKLHGLAATSGEQLWRYVADMPVLTLHATAAPALAGSMVIAGFPSGKIVGLDAGTGTVLWESKLATGEGKTELERMVDVNTPILSGDLIYATSYQGKVGAVSRGAGRELWAQPSSSHLAPGYGSSRLYVVDLEDKVHALRASSGQELWVNEEFLRRKLTSPLGVGDYVAIADRQGYLHVLDSEDGKIIGRLKVDSDGISVPMIAGDETFYVQDNGGDLTAYTLKEK